MILKTLKTNFFNALEGYYPETEIQSFFNLLTEHILKMKRIDVALNLYALVSGKKREKYQSAIKYLKEYRPIQYIIGETEFYDLPFAVNENTLIPRPETEELVELIIRNITSSAVEKSLRILDIGTGTGCIAISLAKHLPSAKIMGMEVSEEALKVAEQNAKLNGVEVEFLHGDILNLRQLELVSVSHSYDIIVSNPPYVRNLEKSEINANVLEHEPHLALFVDDNNPLEFYKAICEFAKNHLNVGGTLYFEINQYLGKEMIQLLKDFDFKSVELRQDIFGNDRMIKGIKENR